MSLFENVIGSKTNFCRTDKNNVLTGENTFNGVINLNGAINGIEITDIQNLQSELDTKASNIDLQNEITNRTQSDNILASQIILKANQTALNTEITNRENADNAINTELITKSTVLDLQNEITNRENADTDIQNQINLKLDEANSNHFPNYSFYCVDNRNDLHSVLPNINNQGSTISVSSGSFGNTDPLTIDKNNLSIYSVPSTPPIVEFNAPLTIPNTALRIRFNYLSFDNVCILNGRNFVCSNTTFNNDCFIGEAMNTYQTYNNCEFSSAKTITFSNQLAGPVYFINCNIAGANLVFNNLSPLLLIFSNCSGFVSLPSTAQATLVGLNVKADGSIVQQNISKIVLPTGEGTNNQVLTSTGTGNCIWTTPSGSGSGGGVCLECIMVIPKGQTITTKSGQSLTFENPTTSQSLLQLGAYSVLTGGTFSYLPPSGTKLVIMSFSFKFGYPGTTNGTYSLSFQVRTGPDTTPFNSQSIIPSQSALIVNASMGHGEYTISVPINIDPSGTNSITNGLLTSWTTPKLFFFAGSKDTSSTQLYIHQKSGYGGTFDNNNFSPPYLKIEAFS